MSIDPVDPKVWGDGAEIRRYINEHILEWVERQREAETLTTADLMIRDIERFLAD